MTGCQGLSHDALLQLVPPAARYCRQPLADEQNALSYWSQAAEALVEPHEGPLDAWLEASCGDGAPACPGDAATVARLRAYVADNRDVFELLRAGVRCGRVQFPVFADEGGSLDAHAAALSPLYHLPKAWLCLARLRLAEDRLLEAARELVGLGEMGHLLCCGESFPMHYLTGSAVLDLADTGIRWIAAAPTASAAVLEELSAAVDRWLADADGPAQCLRVDLCSYAIPEVVRLAAGHDVEAVVEQILERHFANEPLPPADGAEPATAGDDGRRAWRRDGIRTLLAGHPHPFDPIATVRQLGQLVADRIASLQEESGAGRSSLWRRVVRLYRTSRFRARLRLWPAQFRAAFPYDCLGPSDDALRGLAELQEHLSARTWAEVQPPTAAQLQALGKRVRTIPNALGLLVAAELLPINLAPIEQRRRAKLQALRTLLAAHRSPA